MRKAVRDDSAVAVAIVFAVAIGAVVALAIGRDQARVTARLLPDLVAFLGTRDATGQKVGYAVTLLAYFSVLAAIGASGWRPRPLALPANAVAGALLALKIVWVLGQRSPETRVLTAAVAVAGIGAMAQLLTLQGRPWFGLATRLLLCAVLAWSLIQLGIGFIVPVRFDALELSVFVSGFEAHYAALMGERQQLAAGLPVIETVQPVYGFLWPVLGAILERRIGPFGIAGSVRVVQAGQLLFAGLYTAALLVHARRAWLGASVALLIALPWIGTLHPSVLHPNQSGLRFAGIALGMLAAVLAGRRPGRGVALLGMAASLALLVNYEAGVAVTAGLGLLAVIGGTERGPAAVLAAATRFAAGLAVPLGVFWLVSSALLGQAPSPLVLLFWPFFRSAELAVLGLNLYLDPWIVLIGLHSAAVLGRALLAWGHRSLTRRERTGAALAMVILVWMNYWIGRPHRWNAWSFLALYGPFAADTLAPAALRLYRASLKHRRVKAGLAAAALLLLPLVPSVQREAVAPLLREWSRPPLAATSAVALSGAWFEPLVAARIAAKAQLTREAAAAGPVAIITAHSFTVPELSGQPALTQERDAFFHIATPGQRQGYVEQLLRLSPKVILIDPPENLPEGHRRLFAWIEAALAPHYVAASDSGPWRWLERKN